MSKKKKIIIAAVLVLLLGLTGGVIYLNKYYLPRVIKEKIIIGLAKFTSGKVELDNIHFNLFRGVVLENLTLYNKDNPQSKLCHIKEVSASVLILPSFKAKKIIIPSLAIKSALIHLSRDKDNRFNISYLLDKKAQTGSGDNAPLIKNITITESSIFFTDNTINPPARIDANNISIHTNVSFTEARAEGSFTVSKDNKKTNVEINAEYAFADKSLKGGLIVNDLDVNTYQSYIDGLNFTLTSAHINQLQCGCQIQSQNIQTQAKISLDGISLEKNGFYLKDAQLNIDASAQTTKNNLKSIRYQGQANIVKSALSIDKTALINADISSATADFEGDNTAISLTADIKAGNIDVKKDDIAVSEADASIQAQINIPFTKEDGQAIVYQGQAAINAKQISGIPKIGEITDTTIQLSFINQDLTLTSFTGKALSAGIEAKGSLKNKILSLDINGTFALNQLTRFVPKSINLTPYKISGASSTSIHMDADLESEQKLAFNLKAELADIKISRADNNLLITSPGGNITFDTRKKQMKCQFEKISYLNEIYYLDAEMTGFPDTHINANIRDKNRSLSLKADKDGDLIKILSLQGKFIDSDISLKGTIGLKSEMSLSGNIVLELKDLKNILPDQKILEKMNPQGKLLIVGQVSGPPKNWRLWSVKASAKCRTLNIYNLNINNLSAEYTQIEKDAFLSSLAFNAYNGTGLMQGRFDFSDKAPAYSIRGKIENIDINLLKDDTTWKDKVFYGTFSSLFSFGGNGFDTASILGEGNVSIENGNIWEFNPLKGLGSFLFSPGFTKISFTHAHGDFSIADNYITTNNLEVLGSELGLLVEGKISFKGDLDLLVNTQLAAAGPLKKNKGVQKVEGLANAVVGGVTTLKIEGSIEKPTYKLQSIEKSIVKTVGGLISNIFQ